jgi:hypothetical protein
MQLWRMHKVARWDDDDDANSYDALRLRVSILKLAMLRKPYLTLFTFHWILRIDTKLIATGC